MVMDLHELDELMRSAAAPFEHRHMNDICVFREKKPSSENIAKIMGDVIVKAVAGRALRVRCCEVFETDRSLARYVQLDWYFG